MNASEEKIKQAFKDKNWNEIKTEDGNITVEAEVGHPDGEKELICIKKLKNFEEL